jgi:hypothetical protein
MSADAELLPIWTARVLSPENVMRLATSEDDIGLVIHSHLMMEEWLVRWSEAQLQRPGLIDGLKIGYSARLNLAVRLGLPEAAKAAFGKLDEIRNRVGHRLNYRLVPSEIDAFADAVDVLRNREGGRSSCKDEALQVFNSDSSVKIPKTEYRSAGERIKLVIALGALIRDLAAFSVVTPSSTTS